MTPVKLGRLCPIPEAAQMLGIQCDVAGLDLPARRAQATPGAADHRAKDLFAGRTGRKVGKFKSATSNS